MTATLLDVAVSLSQRLSALSGAKMRYIYDGILGRRAGSRGDRPMQRRKNYEQGVGASTSHSEACTSGQLGRHKFVARAAAQLDKTRSVAYAAKCGKRGRPPNNHIVGAHTLVDWWCRTARFTRQTRVWRSKRIRRRSFWHGYKVRRGRHRDETNARCYQ